MIIVGSLIFIAIVVATLSITLPITLQNRDDQTNNNVTNSTDLPISTSRPSNITSMSRIIRIWTDEIAHWSIEFLVNNTIVPSQRSLEGKEIQNDRNILRSITEDLFEYEI